MRIIKWMNNLKRVRDRSFLSKCNWKTRLSFLATSLSFLLGNLVLISVPLRADGFSLSLFQGFTDNIFQNYLGVHDSISIISLEADKSIGHLSLFTQGNLSYVYQNSSLSYYTHQLGVDWVVPVAEKSAIYLALMGKGAWYRQEYQDFNHLALQGRLSWKSYLSPTSILLIDSGGEIRNYSVSIFDYFSSYFDLNIDKYWPSRTTLKVGLSWGWKHYPHPFLAELSPEMTSDMSWSSLSGSHLTSDVFLPFLSLASGPMFQHHHGGPGGYSGMMDYARPSPDGESESIQILSLSMVVAQGLGNRVGLNFSGQHQWIISGANPYQVLDEYYLVENPTYNRFAWAGSQLATYLTLLGPWNLEGKLGYTVSWKDYPGIQSFDLEGNPLEDERHDRRHEIQARLEKDFPKFPLYLSLQAVRNISNDPYFDWQGLFLSVGMNWNFFFGEKQ